MENEIAMNIIVGVIAVATIILSVWMIWERYIEVKHQVFDSEGRLVSELVK